MMIQNAGICADNAIPFDIILKIPVEDKKKEQKQAKKNSGD